MTSSNPRITIVGYGSQGRAHALNPVSYTHLDVYKRQVLTALNLAHELQQSQTPATPRSGDPFVLLDDANRKLDALLAAS